MTNKLISHRRITNIHVQRVSRSDLIGSSHQTILIQQHNQQLTDHLLTNHILSNNKVCRQTSRLGSFINKRFTINHTIASYNREKKRSEPTKQKNQETDQDFPSTSTHTTEAAIQDDCAEYRDKKCTSHDLKRPWPARRRE